MNGLQAYQRVNTQTSITDADPHKLIQLLYNGAIERINMAKAKMQAKDYAGKAQLLNKAIEIISSPEVSGICLPLTQPFSAAGGNFGVNFGVSFGDLRPLGGYFNST